MCARVCFIALITITSGCECIICCLLMFQFPRLNGEEGGWLGAGGVRIQMPRCVWHWETGAGRSCGGQNSLQFTSRFLQQVARVVWCGDISPASSRIQGVRTWSGWQALQKHRGAADWWEYQWLSFDYDWFGCNLVHESLFVLRARSVWWAARGWWGIHPQVWHQKMLASTSVTPHWHKQPPPQKKGV